MSNSIQFQADISVSPKNYSKSYNRKGQIGRVLNKNILEFNQKLEINANGCKIPLNGEIRNALAIKSHKLSIKNQMDVQIWPLSSCFLAVVPLLRDFRIF